jgi:hypothetical protein
MLIDIHAKQITALITSNYKKRMAELVASTTAAPSQAVQQSSKQQAWIKK